MTACRGCGRIIDATREDHISNNQIPVSGPRGGANDMPLPRRNTAARKESPEAGFASSEHTTGFQVPDGDYTITDCMTGINTYGNTIPDGPPAFLVVYEAEDGTTFEQPYNAASDTKYLLPSEDGERFVHPDGESAAKIYGGGAAHMWLRSWEEAGHEFTGNVASQFKGLRVRLVPAAAPQGKGGDNKNKDKTIPLIGKILGKAAPARPTSGRPVARPAAGRSTTATAATRSSPASQSANGELDDAALALVMEVLEKAPDQTMTVSKLAMGVWMKAQKDPDYKGQAQAIKKLITPEFLEGKDGIETDGEQVALAS